MIFVGIDPGKSGAMAVINEKGEVVCTPFDKEAYIDVLSSAPVGETFCVLERVSAMPGQGTVSMFTFGENYGWIQGILDSFGIPYELVRPQAWKKSFGVTKDKNSSIAVAKRLFPRANFKRTERSLKDDDGLCEAALIAEYARRIYS